MDPNMLVV